jgi:hypothetical protein
MCQGCRARGWQETEGSPEEIGSLLEYGRELELGQYVRRPYVALRRGLPKSEQAPHYGTLYGTENSLTACDKVE